MPRIKPVTIGERFTKLVIVSVLPTKNGNVYWLCKCDCGKTREVTGGNLRSKRVISCGCYRRTGTDRYKNLQGRRFGKLLVTDVYYTQITTRKSESRPKKDTAWLCKCDCGQYVYVTTARLNLGTKSCGCLRKRSGPDNPKWNPDAVRGRYTGENKSQEMYFRRKVLERDKYICRKCNKDCKYNSQAHHLNCWNDFPEQRYDVDNGITLCVDCHKKFHKTFGPKCVKADFDNYLKDY